MEWFTKSWVVANQHIGTYGQYDLFVAPQVSEEWMKSASVWSMRIDQGLDHNNAYLMKTFNNNLRELRCLNNKRYWECHAWAPCDNDRNQYLRLIPNQHCSWVLLWHEDTFLEKSSKWRNYLRVNKVIEPRENFAAPLARLVGTPPAKLEMVRISPRTGNRGVLFLGERGAAWYPRKKILTLEPKT